MWNYKTSNEPLKHATQLRVHKEHLERLIQVKGKLDNKTPLKPNFLVKKPAKILSEKTRLQQIDWENRLIYDRMHSISTKHSPYSMQISKPVYCPAFDKVTFNWVPNRQKYELSQTNKWLYKRFTSAKSHYPIKEYLKQNDFHRYLEKNIQKNNNSSNPNITYSTFRGFKRHLSNAINTKKQPLTRINSSIGIRGEQIIGVEHGGFYTTRRVNKSNSTGNLHTGHIVFD